MFNEYVLRPLINRLSVKLIRDSETPLSSWELSNFINNFSTYYYKFELLDTIALALNNGINAENIVIMNRSFLLNKSYAKLNVMNLNSNDIGILSELGEPTSLYPNDELYKLKLLFRAYNLMNEALTSHEFKRVPKEHLIEHTQKLLEGDSLEDVLDSLMAFPLNYISHFLNRAEYQKSAQATSDKLLSDQQKTVKTYKAYVENREFIEKTKGQLADNLENIPAKQDINLFKEYFLEFFVFLRKVSRPVVGVFYPETKSLKILCIAQINKEKIDATFLDVKQVSHSSPLGVTVDGGGFLAKLVDVLVSSDRRHLENEVLKEQIKTEKEKQRTEQEKQKTEQLKREIAILDKIQANASPDVPKSQLNKVANKYLSTELKVTEEKVELGLVDTMKRNKFHINENSIQRIDYKV
ncbi:MAG TPA: hypothetical protein VHY08_11220 [Bacillota bacterium]|nr:hypothetical protein [Bacillota bacterium]